MNGKPNSIECDMPLANKRSMLHEKLMYPAPGQNLPGLE